MGKNSFVYYLDWAEQLLELPDELRLKIDDAIKRYVLYGEEPTDQVVQYSAFGLIRKQIDKDANRWNEIREKRTKSAKCRWTQVQQVDTNGCTCKQVDTNGGVNVNVNVNDNVFSNEDILKENYKKKKGGYAAVAATRLDDRKKEFYNSVFALAVSYSDEMLTNFYEYWSECNKSNTKMRFELERTWDIKRRLKVWASREMQFNKINRTNNITTNPTTAEERYNDAAIRATQLLAEDDADENH